MGSRHGVVLAIIDIVYLAGGFRCQGDTTFSQSTGKEKREAAYEDRAASVENSAGMLPTSVLKSRRLCGAAARTRQWFGLQHQQPLPVRTPRPRGRFGHLHLS